MDNKYIGLGKTIIIILVVVGLGLFAMNQGLAYIYKVQLLAKPCKLCEELNPHLNECFNKQSIKKINDPFARTYNITLPNYSALSG